MNMVAAARAVWRAPTLVSVLIFGVAGLGFTVANLLFARSLSIEEYALFTLVLALYNVGYALAPAGLDSAVNRHMLAANPGLLGRALAVSCVVGVVVSLVAYLVYDLAADLIALVFAACTAGGVMLVAGAKLQSEQRFGPSLVVVQSPNMVLLLAAALAMAVGTTEARLPLVISAAGLVVAAALSWRILLREKSGAAPASSAIRWRETLLLGGFNAPHLIMVQLERLVLPYVLPLAALALFGVLMAIAGSLFRLLQMGIGFSLLPRLSRAASVRERRRLLWNEAWLAAAIALLGSAGIVVAAPLVEHWLLAGKYHLAASLLAAAIVSGIAKILNGFALAAATALATEGELALLNVASWLAIGVALIGAVIGARFGLAGVIYGVAAGWGLRALVAFAFVARHLRGEGVLTEAKAEPEAQ